MSVLNGSSAIGFLAADAGSAGGYTISRSLRFNSSDSAYLSKNCSAPSSSWTLSLWVKRSKLSTYQYFFGPRMPGYNVGLVFHDDNRLRWYDTDGTNNYNYYSTAVFRDVAAWYHIVMRVSAGAFTIYVNNTSHITGNLYAGLQSGNWFLGSVTASLYHLDGYLADIHFIDGQALDPSSFGEFDANNVWQPKAFSGGSYGTNGFHLDFADNSNNTASTLGKDTSGNGNNWTPSGTISVTTGFYTKTGNISSSSATITNTTNSGVTAGDLVISSNFPTGTKVNSTTSTTIVCSANANTTATGATVSFVNPTTAAGNDSLVDSPVSSPGQTDSGAGGTVVGNYCTFNPLSLGAGVALANGNLDVTLSGTNAGALGTMAMPSGKWYFEGTVGGTGNNVFIAIRNAANTQGYFYATSGLKSDFSAAVAYGASSTTGDVLGVAFDNTAGTITFYKNGVSQGVAYSSISATDTWFPYWYSNVAVSTAWSFNFGQRPFAYTAPSGFKALCTANLPTPTIANGATAMDVKLYTGNGSTQTISGLDFSPDFVWLKGRSGATDHALYDIVRGVQKDLVSNSTAAETTQTTGLTAFNSGGFDLGSLAKLNTSSATYAAWCWDAGSSTVSNTQGSITSSVRANASAGFSIVNAPISSSGGSIGHGLNVSPGLIIVKNRGTSGTNWVVWHSSLGTNDYLLLNSTGAKATSANLFNGVSGSTFTVGSGFAASTLDFICYVFSPVAGYSSFGSYVGNGSASDGPFVYTGFRPRWLMIKVTNISGESWVIKDAVRNPYNPVEANFYADLSASEQTSNSPRLIDFTSNGFKLRGTEVSVNGSGNTYVYMCFAESPFAYARAR